MSGFHFDISGIVFHAEDHAHTGLGSIMWRDLSPGVKGCILAMATECAEDQKHAVRHEFAFSDLAPETLARFIEDWELACAPGLARTDTIDCGKLFWSLRQRGIYCGLPRQQFPPLAVYLNNEGTVSIREAAQ